MKCDYCFSDLKEVFFNYETTILDTNKKHIIVLAKEKHCSQCNYSFMDDDDCSFLDNKIKELKKG